MDKIIEKVYQASANPVNSSLRMPESYFAKNFNTGLNQNDLVKYQQWVAQQSQKQGRDLGRDTANYDLQGFWKSGLAQAGNGHMPDTYKKPNHPTFSDQSQYHGTVNPYGGRWIGGQWTESGYTPSAEMLQHTVSPRMMNDYFNMVEPGMTLSFPQDKQSQQKVIRAFLPGQTIVDNYSPR